MTATQSRAIAAMLANDEVSTDAELVEHFVSEVGISRAEALQAVSKREQFL